MTQTKIESLLKKGVLTFFLMLVPSYVFASGGHGEGEALTFMWTVAGGILLIELLVLLFLYRDILMSINVLLVSIFSSFILLYLSSMILHDVSLDMMIWIFGPPILMIIVPIGISQMYIRFIKPIIEKNLVIKMVNYVLLFILILSVGTNLIFVR